MSQANQQDPRNGSHRNTKELALAGIPKRVLGLLLLALLGYGAVSNSLHPQILAELPDALTGQPADSANPDSRATNISYQRFDINGDINYQVKASEMRQFLAQRKAEIDTPEVMLITASAGQWQINSSYGEVLRPDVEVGAPIDSSYIQSGDQMLLSGGVRVLQGVAENGGNATISLETDYLRVFPEHKSATTDAPVVVRSANVETRAQGLDLDLASGIARFPRHATQRIITVIQLSGEQGVSG